jgi:hypothetical protein
MHVSQSVPWQLKIAAKLVLARIPLSYRFWKRAGLFNLGGMERPEYALSVFRRHFDAANFGRKRGNFVGLELGPGDSLFSALIARSFGASRTYLVDVGPFMCPDVTFYRQMEFHLRELGLQPPSLANCSTLNDVISACSAEYLTEGLGSLRKLPSGSVDFVGLMRFCNTCGGANFCLRCWNCAASSVQKVSVRTVSPSPTSWAES